LKYWQTDKWKEKQMMLYGNLIIPIIALGILGVLYIGFAWALARLWCKPKRLPVTKSPADFDMAFERVQYFSHGIGIDGWFIPTGTDTFQPPVIVLAHGWCKNVAEMLPLAQILHRAGFALLLYDARGHGASGEDGPITILKFAQDIISAVDYLDGRGDIDKKRLGILGRSIGGSAAILAASMDQRIQAIVSCSAFADPKTLTKDFLTMKHIPADVFAPLVFRFIEDWLGTKLDSIAPQNRIGNVAVPILLIHGEADRYIRSSNMDTLFARAPEEYRQHLLISGRGHSDVLRDSNCIQEIAAFFNENLHPNNNQLFEMTSASRLPVET
jgi:alpha-beta hydrolase superfamily lysophospholipase